MIATGQSKFLKLLKKIEFGFFNDEFFINKINGPNPNKIIKKYLKKTSKEYLL